MNIPEHVLESVVEEWGDHQALSLTIELINDLIQDGMYRDIDAILSDWAENGGPSLGLMMIVALMTWEDRDNLPRRCQFIARLNDRLDFENVAHECLFREDN